MSAAPSPFIIHRGSGPIILAMPHGGTFVPNGIAVKLNANGRLLADTDWHIAQLYGGLLPEATIVQSMFHRYVIDANRDPSGASLYPGQNTTSLIPLTDFDNQPIWQEPPTDADTAERIATFHAPYHQALTAEIERIKALHGTAILYDCHSIRSVVPFLFDGVLQVLNIGTDNDKTCDRRIEAAASKIAAASGFSHVVNGRFRGGWTTRHYGKPAQNVHAIQMEIAQSAYLETEAAPFAYSESKAAKLRPHLANILKSLAALALELAP
jgi:N-formylglutamate deformylase